MYDYKVVAHEAIELGSFMKNVFLTPNIQLTQVLIYMVKGEKYFVLTDDKGWFTTFTRKGEFRSRFYSMFPKIDSLSKHSISLIYTAGSKVGFIKFSESHVGALYCDVGDEKATRVSLDYNNGGIIYVSTQSGNILVFEAKNLLVRPEFVECNYKGKLKTGIAEALHKPFEMRALKGSLLMQAHTGELRLYHSSNMAELLDDDQALPHTYIPHFLETQEESKIASIVPYIPETRTQSGNYILLQVPGHPERLALYECLIPHVRPEAMTDWFNFRFPMFIVAFALVIGYQVYKRKFGKTAGDDEGDLVKKLGGRGPDGKKMTKGMKDELK